MATFVNINVSLSFKKYYQKRVASYVKTENNQVLIIIQELIACKYIFPANCYFQNRLSSIYKIPCLKLSAGLGFFLIMLEKFKILQFYTRN